MSEEKFEEIENIYKQISSGKGEDFILLFALQDFVTGCIEFDPVTNEPMQTTVDDVLSSVACADLTPAWWNDRFQRIIDFSSGSIYALLDILHEKNLREHRTSRPEHVREVDSRCMMWLAKKPGFTVKQKIASEQKMMGVYHTTSIDTSENRLFKAFLLKLDDILYAKEKAVKSLGLSVPEKVQRLISVVHSWKYSDECAQISPWNNVPPNNTLLNDKNYRKIWKAWLSLQKIAGQVESDFAHLSELKTRALLFLTVARMNQNAKIRFRQTALFPDYKNFDFNDVRKHSEFSGWCSNNEKNAAWEKISVSAEHSSIIIKIGEKQTQHSVSGSTLSEIADCAKNIVSKVFPALSFMASQKKNSELCKTAAVDLNAVFPSYSRSDMNCRKYSVFSQKLLFQAMQHTEEKAPVYYSCADSKFIWSKLKVIDTISIRNIFDRSLLSKSDSDEMLPSVEKACVDFAETIKKQLHSQNCLYVTSDDIDDFSPSVNAFKRNMNISFVRTEIVPRSIAAVFCRLDEIKEHFTDNERITVRDIYDDYEIRTELKVVVDGKLLKQNPETYGFQFQRLSHKRIDSTNISLSTVPKSLSQVLSNRDAELLSDSFSADDYHFGADRKKTALSVRRSGKSNEIIITPNDDTSTGALLYRKLQDKTPDIYLWSDFLPKLSMVDSSGEEFILVNPEKAPPVHPIVGKPVSISIREHFSFPAKKAFYEFPLIQGEKKEKSRYFAFIKDSSFPLDSETECCLNLTYTYGKDYPYHLEFISLADNAPFRSVAVKWENREHKDYIHDMPVPDFVREYSWAGMRAVSGRKNGKNSISNLIDEWLPSEYRKINSFGIYRIVRQISSKKKGQGVFFLDKICPNGKNPICYIEDNQKAKIDDEVWCYLDKVANGYQAFDPHVVGKKQNQCTFTKSLRFPAITVWNNGRSIFDKDCPSDFKEKTLEIIDKLQSCFGSDVPECVKHELMFLLCCMHKDMPQWFSNFLPQILSKIEEHYDYPNWIAYSLGDCSQNWQKSLLQKTLDLLDNNDKSNYAIKILAKSLWRVNTFVYNLTELRVKAILNTVNNLLERRQNNSQETILVRSACLECLVALCRLRESANGNLPSEEMLCLLSPEKNNILKMILEKLNKIKKQYFLENPWGDLLNDGTAFIKTFLTFEIARPSDDKTPELLYAAYGYLSGQIDSNAIKVLEADFSE